jgi:antitoxin FitA
MCCACDTVRCMGHIQIRNVPDDVHRTLKARAAKAGMTLSDFLLRDLLVTAGRPTWDEISERIARRPRVHLKPSAAEVVREERESRERELAGRHRAGR